MASLFSRLTNRKIAYKQEVDQKIQPKIDRTINGIPKDIDAFARRMIFSDGKKILEGNYQAFDDIDTNLLQEEIEVFRRMDLKTVSQDDLEASLRNIISENLVPTYHLHAGVNIYRARAKTVQAFGLEDVFVSSDEVWYAKPKYLKKMGRLNNIGQPLLYASFDALTPIHEIRNKEDEQFALMKYKIKDNQILNLAMIAVEDHKSIAKNMTMKFRWTSKAEQNWKTINDFLRAEFTKQVASGEEYRYRSTIEITRHFDFPGCDGFIYPSIERQDGYNVAIKPESVDRALDFAGLAYWENIHYDKKNVNRDDFRCWQKWSDTIQNGEIIYAPIGPCKIEFPRLSLDTSTIYYKRKDGAR